MSRPIPGTPQDIANFLLSEHRHQLYKAIALRETVRAICKNEFTSYGENKGGRDSCRIITTLVTECVASSLHGTGYVERMRREYQEWQIKDIEHSAFELCSDLIHMHLNPHLNSSPKITEEPIMRNPVDISKPAIEQRIFIHGQDASTLSDDDIFELIAQHEAAAKKLDSFENKPQKLAKKIEDIHASIKALINYVDAR